MSPNSGDNCHQMVTEWVIVHTILPIYCDYCGFCLILSPFVTRGGDTFTIQDMDKQKRINSLIEVLLNVGSGFLLSWLTTLIIIPIILPVKHITAQDGLSITITFTVISLIRSYAWRRYFSNRH